MEGTKLFRANLQALELVQPELAKCLNSMPMPGDSAFSVGRDGTRTVRQLDPDGRWSWFGASSMPTVSASALLDGFQHTGGNVSTPGVLTGLEPLLLTQRIPRHCAVFVVEEEVKAILIALHLFDFTESMASGRLVWLWGSDWPATARVFFEKHPGYLMPTTLLTPPQRLAVDITALQRRMEQLAQEIGEIHHRALSEQVARLRNRNQQRMMPVNPRVAVVGMDATPWAVEQAKRIDRGLGFLGWDHAVCIPDSPRTCHLVARLHAMETIDADIVLNLSDARQLESLLPETIRQVEWRASCPGYLAADVAMLDGQWVAREPSLARPEVVIVAMDVADARPVSLGISLPSHLALWGRLQDAARHAVESHLELPIDPLLSEAETRSGTVLMDLSVREQFLRLTRECLVPWVVAQSMVEALRAVTCKAEFFGANWSALHDEVAADRLLPLGLERRDFLRRIRCAVLPDSSPQFAEFALDCLATAIPVVLRSTQERFAQQYPDLDELTSFLYFFTKPTELRILVARILSGDSAVVRRATDGRACVMERHTVAHRLEKMREGLSRK
ncbi:MAG: hypothetical protein AABZ47_05885 [Planctomycetota bacterium]